jgi:hypothetical protein
MDVIPGSRIANRLIAWVTGVKIHDTGCTLKAFRRELVERLPIYAEQHRFLPAMSKRSGARVSELVGHHRARQFGKSKYGLGRATRVLRICSRSNALVVLAAWLPGAGRSP